MAQLGKNFDANEHEPQAPRELLPAGNYPAAITSSEVKDNRNQTGTILALIWTVTEGDYRSVSVFQNLNIIHQTSPKAQEIGERELSTICHATGKMQVSDSEQLHNVPCIITVGMERRNDKPDEIRNVVKGVRQYDAAMAQAAPLRVNNPNPAASLAPVATAGAHQPPLPPTSAPAPAAAPATTGAPPAAPASAGKAPWQK